MVASRTASWRRSTPSSHGSTAGSRRAIPPHTAVAAGCWLNYRKKTGSRTPTVILSTANPYKFPQDVLFALTGDDVRDSFRACKKLLNQTGMEIPESIMALKTKPKLHQKVLPAQELKNIVLSELG